MSGPIEAAIDGRLEGLLPRHRVEELELRRRRLLRHGKSLTLQIPATAAGKRTGHRWRFLDPLAKLAK